MASSPAAAAPPPPPPPPQYIDNKSLININLNRIVSDYLEKRGLYKSLKIF